MGGTASGRRTGIAIACGTGARLQSFGPQFRHISGAGFDLLHNLRLCQTCGCSLHDLLALCAFAPLACRRPCAYQTNKACSARNTECCRCFPSGESGVKAICSGSEGIAPCFLRDRFKRRFFCRRVWLALAAGAGVAVNATISDQTLDVAVLVDVAAILDRILIFCIGRTSFRVEKRTSRGR